MKTMALAVFLLFSLASWCGGPAQQPATDKTQNCGDPTVTFAFCHNSQTVGVPQIIADVRVNNLIGAMDATFEVVVNGTIPSGMSVSVWGCSISGNCRALPESTDYETYGAVRAGFLLPAPKIASYYSYFIVEPWVWCGIDPMNGIPCGSDTTVTINTTLTTS